MNDRIRGIHETTPAIKVIGEQMTKAPERRVRQSANSQLAKEDYGKREGVSVPPKPEMEDMVDDANRIIFGENRRAEFNIHEGTGKIMVKLVDLETGDVVREIPPEKIVDMMTHLRELIGLVVDETI